jgi:hypothetical protein
VSGFANGDVVEFRVRATDNVNNVQPFPATAQVATIVVLEPISLVLPFEPLIMKPTDPVTDSFTVSWVGFTAPGTTIELYQLRYRFRAADTGAQTPWMDVPLPSPTAQSVDFDGPFDEDGIYEFEVRAANSLGQTEPFTGEGEAIKIIDLRAPFIEPQALFPVVAK